MALNIFPGITYAGHRRGGGVHNNNNNNNDNNHTAGWLVAGVEITPVSRSS